MAAARSAAEGGGGIFFPNSQGGYFQNFSGQGGIPPLFPTPGQKGVLTHDRRFFSKAGYIFYDAIQKMLFLP